MARMQGRNYDRTDYRETDYGRAGSGRRSTVGKTGADRTVSTGRTSATGRTSGAGRTAGTGTTGGRANAGRAYGDYQYGSAVRKVDVRRQLEEEPRRKLSRETRKNRDRARHMSFGYVAFLTVAFCTCAFILINYIQLQAELTNRTKGLARLESQLNTLRQENDEQYHRIVDSIDLEEIKRVAIGELGMTYAQEGQIISYDSVENDYMRQVKEDTK